MWLNGTRSSFRWAVSGVAAFALCLFWGWSGTALQAQSKNDAEQLRKRGEQALKQGEYATAENLFEQYLADNPRDQRTRLALSYALLKQRYFGGAFEHAAKVLEEDRYSARARALLGSALLANGDFRSANEAFRTALLFDEREALAIAGLAMIDFYENRLDESVQQLRRAVSLVPNEPDFIYSLAQAAARSEKFKESADAFERFLIIAPKTDEERRARIRGLISFLRYLGDRHGKLYETDGEQTKLSLEMLTTRPVVPVRINDHAQTQKFVFDTGSGMCVLSEETAKRLGVKPVARGGQARAVGGDGKFDIIYGFLESLQIGDITVHNVPVYIRRFYGNSSNVDGYLGTAAISKYLTTVDYGERTFILSKKRKDSKNGPATVELPMRTTSSGFVSGEVQIEGVAKPLNFIIDTGASISVLSHKLANREELSSLEEGGRLRVFGAAGVEDDVKTLVLPRVLLGAHSQHGISAAVLDLDSINETAGFEQTGIIGGNFLNNYRVTFDFRKGILRLEPQTGGAVPPSGTSATLAVEAEP